tara:strand:- start:243 stop:524 length:282 start_codon:yes stop_codon:yes gene_type:complete
MHLYYPFPNKEASKDASMNIYDLNAPPRSERVTLYAYDWFPNENDDTCVLAWEDEQEVFNTGDILNGITPLTEEEAIEAGYQLGDENSGIRNI